MSNEKKAVKLGGDINENIWGIGGEIKLVVDKSDLTDLANKLNLRDDWHEPSERGVTAEIMGSVFNNAGFWGHKVAITPDNLEMYVRILHKGKSVAEVNLTDLMGWAAAKPLIEPKVPKTKPGKPIKPSIHEAFQTPEFTEFCFELLAGHEIELIDFAYLDPKTIAISSTIDGNAVPRSWALGQLSDSGDIIQVSNTTGVHIFDCMTYPQAWDDLIELIRKGAVEFTRHGSLSVLFDLLKRQMSNMDASDIFHDAFENWQGDYNLETLLGTLGQEPQDILVDYINNLRSTDVDDENFIEAAEDYLNIDVDVIMEHAGCDHHANGEDWLDIADSLQVEIPDNIKHLIEKGDPNRAHKG